MMRPLFISVVCAALMTGCAAGGYMEKPQVEESGENRQVADLEDAMQQAEQELAHTLQAGDRPECERICKLRGTICELASRICEISERHPDEQDVQKKCQDGIERCERARIRVAGSCQCQDVP